MIRRSYQEARSADITVNSPAIVKPMREAQKDPVVTAPELTDAAEYARGLSAQYRQLLMLRKVVSGFTKRTIASRLNIPQHTVEAHLIQAARGCAHAVSTLHSLAKSPSPVERLRPSILRE